jgi:hypothetical protein
METNSIVVLIVLALALHLFVTQFTYKKGSELELLTKENYYDIIHHNFADYTKYHYTKNWITALFVIPFLLRPRLLSKIIWIIPLILIIRSVFTSVTIFPATRENNHNLKLKKPPQTLIDYIIGDNFDRMFSGHIAFAVISSYFFLTQISQTPLSLALTVGLNLIHAFIIVVTRSHYTIDVLNSGVITYLILFKK